MTKRPERVRAAYFVAAFASTNSLIIGAMTSI
jgi:hypothetical protein